MTGDHLHFSRADLSAIEVAAAWLSPHDRPAFFHDVAEALLAEALEGHELGPGILHRIVCEVLLRPAA